MKERPTQANIGTLGVGTAGHFLVAAFARDTGTRIEHVAYVGIAPLTGDLLGGRLAAGVDSLSNLVELHAAGRIRILAMSGVQRSAVLPDIATFGEQGYPAVTGGGWLALYAPAGTPGSIVARWSRVASQNVQEPDNAAKLRRAGLEPTGTTAEELRSIMAADTLYWRPLIKAVGLGVE
jgi:tripartite-type tricarboxylate transporter receptor subunit TctC